MSAEASRPADVWARGAAYEPYVGRWSRLVAREVLAWLAVPPGSRWLDVGCGTGALSQTILALGSPNRLKGLDASAGYVAFARDQLRDERVQFEIGDAQALSEETASYDAVVAGLVLNFVPQPERMVAEMARVVRPGGVVAVYVWDYAGQMQLMRHFWDAAVALDPTAQDLDEGRRFPICQPDRLTDLFRQAELGTVEARPIDVPTRFRDFDDYWSPFLGGQGPAPSYAMSLSEERRAVLRARIRAGLPMATAGSIELIARAWAVRGVREARDRR
jgi:SAM-dependent methyltransferase